MSEPPRFELIGMQPPSELREEIELLPEVYHSLTDGVPGELFAPLYRAAETPTVLRVMPGRDLIQFGASGLGHAICVDPRTGQVVEVLDTRHRSPAMVPDRFWSTFVDDVAIGDYADED